MKSIGCSLGLGCALPLLCVVLATDTLGSLGISRTEPVLWLTLGGLAVGYLAWRHFTREEEEEPGWEAEADGSPLR
ncbi:MAG: hypothetical protein V3V67_14500 [Myxococcota bacterium]